MSLDFGSTLIDSERNRFIAAGPQFEQEETTLFRDFHDHATGTNVSTAYTVPAGKTLLVSQFLVNSYKLGSVKSVAINTGTIYLETISEDSTKQVEFAIPLKVLAGESINCYAGGVGKFYLTTVGWLI